MKLQADRIEGANAISSLTSEAVSVNGVPHRNSILVPWRGEVSAWGGASLEELSASDFERLAEFKPELVIFGSGPRIRFPSAALLRPLIDQRIGVESMDTAAACRTYNILVSEGRSVVAALLLASAVPTV